MQLEARNDAGVNVISRVAIIGLRRIVGNIHVNVGRATLIGRGSGDGKAQHTLAAGRDELAGFHNQCILAVRWITADRPLRIIDRHWIGISPCHIDGGQCAVECQRVAYRGRDINGGVATGCIEPDHFEQTDNKIPGVIRGRVRKISLG